MWAAIPLVEAGAVAVIGVVAGAKITQKVMERVGKKKAKSPSSSSNEHHQSRPYKTSHNSDTDTDLDDLDSDIGSQRSDSRFRPKEQRRTSLHDVPRKQVNDTHILHVLQSLPKRKFLLVNLAPEDDRRRSRASKWRTVSPYGTSSNEPEWLQQGYSSHEEWYNDLDSDSKLAYLGYLYDLLKQARKKSTKDLEQSVSRKRRDHRTSLYALVEQQALSERRNDERRHARPLTPTGDFLPQDPRVTSWVNTLDPERAFSSRESESGYYSNATEAFNNTRGPYSPTQQFEDDYYPGVTGFSDNTGGARLHSRSRRQNVRDEYVEPAGSGNRNVNVNSGEHRQRSNASRARQPRSRSSTPLRDRSRSRAVDLYKEDNEL